MTCKPKPGAIVWAARSPPNLGVTQLTVRVSHLSTVLAEDAEGVLHRFEHWCRCHADESYAGKPAPGLPGEHFARSKPGTYRGTVYPARFVWVFESEEGAEKWCALQRVGAST